MVETFYERVRDDASLGPIFERSLRAPWPEHLDRMVDFWATVLLGVPRFEGNPVARHRAIAELQPEHFDRWLELFREVLDELFPEHIATDIYTRAGRMRLVLDSGPSPGSHHHMTVISKTRATR